MVKRAENASKTKNKATEYFHNVRLFMVEISTRYFHFSGVKTIYRDFLNFFPK